MCFIVFSAVLMLCWTLTAAYVITRIPTFGGFETAVLTSAAVPFFVSLLMYHRLTFFDEVFGDGELHCPQCGYLLKGVTEPRCPECGRVF